MINWALELPPLDEGGSQMVDLIYQDQTGFLRRRANRIPVKSVLGKESGLIGGLKYIEGYSNLWHPDASEAYIDFFTQLLASMIFWPDLDFPNVDPDPIYTQVWCKYFDAATELHNENVKEQDLHDRLQSLYDAGVKNHETRELSNEYEKFKENRKYKKTFCELSKQYAQKLFDARRQSEESVEMINELDSEEALAVTEKFESIDLSEPVDTSAKGAKDTEAEDDGFVIV